MTRMTKLLKLKENKKRHAAVSVSYREMRVYNFSSRISLMTLTLVLVGKHITKEKLADMIECSIPTVYRRLAIGDYTLKEAERVAVRLNLTQREALEIFFPRLCLNAQAQ